MSVKVCINLLPLWHEKEKQIGKRLTIKDVAANTKLAYSTVANLRAGKPERVDLKTLSLLCDYFDVPVGSPVPFLVVTDNNKGDHV